MGECVSFEWRVSQWFANKCFSVFEFWILCGMPYAFGTQRGVGVFFPLWTHHQLECERALLCIMRTMVLPLIRAKDVFYYRIFSFSASTIWTETKILRMNFHDISIVVTQWICAPKTPKFCSRLLYCIHLGEHTLVIHIWRHRILGIHPTNICTQISFAAIFLDLNQIISLMLQAK